MSNLETVKKSPTPGYRRAALGYVNPTMACGKDGIQTAEEFFSLRPKPDPTRQIDLAFLRAGRVGLTVLSDGNPDPALFKGAEAFECVVRKMSALRKAIEDRKENCKLVQTKADLRGSDDRLRFLLHLTGAPINGCLQNLDAFYHLGVRAIHPFANQAEIGGFTGGRVQDGLTKFGRQLLKRVQDLSMVFDVAHSNDRTFREVLRLCSGPIINSHTACRSLHDMERNSTDAQLKAVAATGGVVGVHFGSSMLWRVPDEAVAARQAGMKKMAVEVLRMKARYPNPYEFLSHRLDVSKWDEAIGGSIRTKPVMRAPLDRLVDHLLHMLEVAGEDHVALGSDYSLGDLCDGVTQVKHLPRLAAALIRRGVGRPALEKVMWKNWLRVYGDVLPLQSL